MDAESIMLITSYTFITIAIGTIFLSLAATIIGALNLYQGQSLIGDAIGHSTFPGIVLFFMIFQTRNPLILLLGSMFTGTISYWLIQLTNRYSKLNLDACLAIYLTGFFGLGMVLKSLIQGTRGASQSGLETYIFGQAAYMMETDIKIIIGVAFVVLLLFILFYHQLTTFIFDKEYAISQGLNTKLITAVLLIMTIIVVSIGLKAVGSILISSFMILPTVLANQWSKDLKGVIVIGSLAAMFSAILGTYLSSLYSGLSTGPTIILIMGGLTFLSIIFGKYGLIRRKHV